MDTNTPEMRYTFRCPLCGKFFTHDEPGEPCCTGPSEMRDDHPLTVMRLTRIAGEHVNPVRAEQRAQGTLLMSTASPQRLQRDALILTAK